MTFGEDDEAPAGRRRVSPAGLRFGFVVCRRPKAGGLQQESRCCFASGFVSEHSKWRERCCCGMSGLSIPSSSSIEIVGNAHLTRAQLLSVFGEDVERNIFSVPLVQRRAELESLPWVAHATVMRLLPNRMRVSIVERVPVAFVRQGSHIGLVDAGGVAAGYASGCKGGRALFVSRSHGNLRRRSAVDPCGANEDI